MFERDRVACLLDDSRVGGDRLLEAFFLDQERGLSARLPARETLPYLSFDGGA